MIAAAAAAVDDAAWILKRLGFATGVVLVGAVETRRLGRGLGSKGGCWALKRSAQ